MKPYVLNPLYDYAATVLRVVDADTVDLEVDLGFSTSVKTRFRLFGINAYELRTPAGKAAKVRAQELLPVGAKVEVNTIKDKKDKYGRYLVVIYRGEGTVNELLVSEGLAVEYYP